MTHELPRRQFLKATGVGAAALPFAGLVSPLAGKPMAGPLRVGLVGCGGRGTGAAMQALNADKEVILWSVGDLFGDRLESSLSGLKENFGDRVQIPEDRRFVGFDAYKKVIEQVDVILFATPPAFRPMHLAAAIEADLHVFCEKPIAVDAHGVRSVLATAKLAQQKGLSLASGFCWRAANGHRAIYNKVHQGGIGDVRHVYGTYLGGGLWYKKRQENWTDMEYQLRNWLYYTALSGDHIAEQAVHSVDKIMWAKQDVPPASATAIGGRQVRTEEKWGNVYDHFGVMYEWEDGSMGHLQCRQQNGAHSENLDRILGSNGTAYVDGWASKFTIVGEKPWQYEGPGNNMYQTEHDELFASIRSGGAMNQGQSMAYSTLAALMGRMSAYTGKKITWEQALNSEERLTPDNWEFGPGLPAPISQPGKTKFL
jgi:myo-inositol 2-dehydrogenase/D-chiro-inositol 1-dehydrogenase